VPGNGVRALKTGSPGGHISICCRVRSATPAVSLSSPNMNQVIA
jgi:hypothetical protein